MMWTPDPDALQGRVALVAGATRGAGRGIAAALGEAADPGRARWNQSSVSSADLALAYGFTDVDGRRPNSWAAEQ